MRVYKQTKEGFIEEINTDGNYHPSGWSKTKEAARGKAKCGNG